MKNIIAILTLTILLMSTTGSRALDYTYSTNDFWALDYPTNIYIGTNAFDGKTNGDTFATWARKLNGAMNLFQRRWVAQKATNDFIFTNPPSGGGGGLTNIVFTNSVGAAIVQTFNNGSWAAYTVSLTNTVTVTNTVTAYALSNSVLSSKRVQTYSTNNAFWGTSNFLARVSGLYDFRYGGGNDGANPPAAIASHLVGSYSGSNSWFTITNGFRTTNTISVAHIRDGAAPVNPGSASLFTVDHFELLNRTNYLFGQFTRFDYPANDSDAATKGYADALFASAFNANWSFNTDTNGIYHTVYQRFNFNVVDMATATGWIPIATNSFDGANMLMVIQQTNLVSGWFIESMTNLIYQSQWATFTNYTLSTNSGAVTFTIPINMSEEARFFRARGSATNSVTFNAQVRINDGLAWPSNTWNLARLTNQLNQLGTGKHYWTGSSNGLALVTLSYSNGVVRWIRADY